MNSDTPAEAYADAETESGKKVKDELTDLIAKIGENMSFRRATRLEVKNGVVSGYMHGAISPNMGKIGVLVALESTGDQEKTARTWQTNRHACCSRIPEIPETGRS